MLISEHCFTLLMQFFTEKQLVSVTTLNETYYTSLGLSAYEFDVIIF